MTQKNGNGTDKKILMVFTDDNEFIIPAFELAALYAGWPEEKISEFVKLLQEKTPEEQKRFLTESTIFIWMYHDRITQTDVQYALHESGCSTHYLYSKELPGWNSFDWSLFLLLIAEFEQKHLFVYAIFAKETTNKEKYRVPPIHPFVFNSTEKCDAFLKEQWEKGNEYVSHSIWVQTTN